MDPAIIGLGVGIAGEWRSDPFRQPGRGVIGTSADARR